MNFPFKSIKFARFLHFTAIGKRSSENKIEQPKIPTKTLYNGHKIPFIGLGTWGSVEKDVKYAVETAIHCGYRMIDTAYVYENEKFVGQAIQQMIQKKVVKRSDLFVTTKLWNTFHTADLVPKAMRLSLNNLQLQYVDLYLMHWPTAYQEGNILFPRDALGRTKFSDVDYIETWKAMEELVDRDLTKSIGISNFNKDQLERLWNAARIKPAVLQCECHPFLNQKYLMKYCQKMDIVFTAYSPLGSWDNRPYAVRGEERLLQSKKIIEIAERNNKTPAQILLRFQIQRGNTVIPKSITKYEMENNLQIFDWELTPGDMNLLLDMNKNHRYVIKIEWANKLNLTKNFIINFQNFYREAAKHKYYPFLDDLK